MLSNNVNQVSRRKLQELKNRKREVSAREHALFEDCLQKVHDSSMQKELSELIRVIQREGERLVHSRSLEQLNYYKAKIRDFIAKANRGTFKVKASGYLDAHGGYATHLVVEKVDAAMEELAQLVMNKEAPAMQLLQKLDLIKGLLTDMYQ